MTTVDPYRKPGERAPVPRDLRRWFTKSGDVEKGPFDASAVRQSLKNGYLKATTLVRPEDEIEWRPLAKVLELTEPPAPMGSAVRSFDEPTHLRGSYGTGFLVGIALGLLGLIVIYATSSHPETRRGARSGFFTRLVLSLFVVAVMLIATRS